MKKFGQFINENNSDYSFRTEVNDVTVYGLEEFLSNEEIDISTSDAKVTWILEPEMRENRIKSMNLGVTRVECQIEIDNGKQYIYFDTDSLEFKEWEIDSQIEFRKDGGICPEDVEIDYRNKKVTIN